MESIEALVAKASGTVGVYAKHLESGQEVKHNENTVFFTASTFKVPLLVEVYRQAEQKRFRLDDRVELTQALKTAGSGVLKELAVGLRPTIRDLAMLMVIVSDNVATDILYNMVGRESLAATVKRLGMARTCIPMNTRDLLCSITRMDPKDPKFNWEECQAKLRNRQIDLNSAGYSEEHSDVSTPADMCHLLELIERRQALTPASCDDMLDIMKRQQYVEIVPLLLPPGTRVANKTGWYYGVRADVGIVYSPKGPYTVALMAKQAYDMVQIGPALAAISRAIYERFVGGS